MGYFSNGTEGMVYEEAYCSRCKFYGPEEGPGCPIWGLHLGHNYEGANDDDHFLHKLIPISEDGLTNLQCKFFIDVPNGRPLFP